MTYQPNGNDFSAFHVAKSRDMYLQGGFLAVTPQGVSSWPWLHMHVRFDGKPGAVWSSPRKDRFLLVLLNPDTAKMEAVKEMLPEELEAFKFKAGVFWTRA